jgi:heme exporter protein A
MMNSDTASSQNLLNARNLRCIRGDRELFGDLSLSVTTGEVLQVHGANGSGKTSLLRILCGLSQPQAGDITWRGISINKDRSVFLRELLYLGHSTGIKLELSPLENLVFSAGLSGRKPNMPLNDALEQVALFGFEHESARTLSAGQRRRIGLARLLISPARLWVLDEPFTALDAAGILILEVMLHRHLKAGGAAVLASHSPVNLHERHITALHLTA